MAPEKLLPHKWIIEGVSSKKDRLITVIWERGESHTKKKKKVDVERNGGRRQLRRGIKLGLMILGKGDPL